MTVLPAAWPRRALAGTGAALALHPHARTLRALLWDGALTVETPSPARPGLIDLHTLVQLDGDVVTTVGCEALATPAALQPTLERHSHTLARGREALRSELAAVTASMSHLWIAGAGGYAILTVQTAPFQAALIAACGPALRLGWRRAKALLVRRSARIFAARLAEGLQAPDAARPRGRTR